MAQWNPYLGAPPKAQPRKGRSQVEINKALTLLGFNSWTAVEPSKS